MPVLCLLFLQQSLVIFHLCLQHVIHGSHARLLRIFQVLHQLIYHRLVFAGNRHQFPHPHALPVSLFQLDKDFRTIQTDILIGKLFPDTDPAYAGADSLKLLAAVADLVREKGYDIVDIDCVVAAQAPKLSPYRDRMRENLAAACGIDVDAIGVKATTTEHLGFEGREEGISAQAVALVHKLKQQGE